MPRVQPVMTGTAQERGAAGHTVGKQNVTNAIAQLPSTFYGDGDPSLCNDAALILSGAPHLN